ncbi:MAG: hypothetical protein R3A11_07590 [Bdellovibrionota bacterium]
MRTDKLKKQRQELIRNLIQKYKLRKQEELAVHVKQGGYKATQTTISRDLVEMGVYKASGIYTLPMDENHPDHFRQEMEKTLHHVLKAGPHMLVLKTDLGGAPKLSVHVEKQNWKEVVGVLAGDDTVFVAFHSSKDMEAVYNRLVDFVQS